MPSLIASAKPPWKFFQWVLNNLSYAWNCINRDGCLYYLTVHIICYGCPGDFMLLLDEGIILKQTN